MFVAALCGNAANDVINPAAPGSVEKSAVSSSSASDPHFVLNKATADSLYAQKQYAEAAKQYALLADSVESSNLYYNLGNAEYKQKNYAQAVLAYERALRIDPDNDDAQYNLALVRTRLADRFSKPSEMFFISWFRTWVSSHSVQTWTSMSYVWFLGIFVCLILYIIGKRMWLRKTGFFAAIFCVLAFLSTTIFAIIQRHAFSSDSDAVVMVDEVELYSSPTTSSKKMRTLHEGTVVAVTDIIKDGWLQVQLPDGQTGYLPSLIGKEKVIESIR